MGATEGSAPYLFFKFGVTKQKLSDKLKHIEVFNGILAIPNVGRMSGVYALDREDGNSFLFHSQVSISVVKPIPIFIVDIGIDYRYLSTSVSFNVIRENLRLLNPELQAKDFPSTYNLDTNGHIISPVIAARVMLPWGLGLRGGIVLSGTSTISDYKAEPQLIAGIHYNIKL